MTESEKLIENLKSAIAKSYDDRYMLEMGDDFCHTNGRYDALTAHIRWLESILKNMEKE